MKFALNATTLANIKRNDSRKRLTDGDGLYLLLFVKGGSHGWRLDYTFNGRRKTLSLGTYPKTSLKLAREKAQAAQALVAAGTDPSASRKMEKLQHKRQKEVQALIVAGQPLPESFTAIARDWFEAQRSDWTEGYARKVLDRLEHDVLPWIGNRPIASITALEVLEVLRRIQDRGAVETAHRVRGYITQVFDCAIATNLMLVNPAGSLHRVMRKPAPVKHRAAILDPDTLSGLLRALHGYSGSLVVRTALKLAPMVMLRPGELRKARWEEFDLDKQTWTIPAVRMKRRRVGKQGEPHIVPLSRQAVMVLRELRPLTCRNDAGLVFRGERDYDRPMSENTINAALRRLGYDTQKEMTGHGFRATARTILAERLGVAPEVIEAQLDHKVKDPLGHAYNRAKYLAQRREIMQLWSDCLECLRLGKPVPEATWRGSHVEPPQALPRLAA